MRRDKKLIKKILLYVRKKANGDPIPYPSFDEYDQRVVNYHVTLCEEAGFIRAARGSASEIIAAADEIGPLTWHGHEQLDQWNGNGD